MREMTEQTSGEAFAGESKAHMKYMIFAEIAEKNGFPNLARMFHAIAYAEQVHATNHARNLGIVQETPQNIQNCIDGENFEVEEMYPAYLAIAELQQEKGAQKAHHYALEAEKIHRTMYREAKAMAEKGVDIEMENIYICPVCGYTHYKGDLPDHCPVCGVNSNKFRKF